MSILDLQMFKLPLIFKTGPHSTGQIIEVEGGKMKSESCC
jgi:hypothetical protein